MGKTLRLSFSVPGSILLFQPLNFNQANRRHVWHCWRYRSLAKETVRPPAEWMHPNAHAHPQKYTAWELYNVLTHRGQEPRTFGKKTSRRKTNSSIHYCSTSSTKNCSTEESRSPLHFRRWSSALNLITCFPTFPLEIHLTCFTPRVCPSLIHRPACWPTSCSLIHPALLAHLQQIF